MNTATLRLALISIALLVIALGSPDSAAAQALSPEEVASAQVSEGHADDSLHLDVSNAHPRRGHRLRAAGYTLIWTGVAGVLTGLAVGIAFDVTDEDGEKFTGLLTGVALASASPAFAVGSGLVVRGYTLDRRARDRARVSAHGAGLRLSF